MQAIDNSNLLNIDANKAYYDKWAPLLKYVWDPAAKTVTVTNMTTLVPTNATKRTVNIQVHDKYGNTARGSMQSGGKGYLVAPAVTIGAPGGGGTQAVATSVIEDGRVVGFVISNAGAGYAAAPAITLAAAPGGGVTATATAVVTNGSLTRIDINVASSGAIDVSNLSPNKGLNISATIVMNNGWSATGSAIQITNDSAGAYLQDWNIQEAPASAAPSLIH